VYTLAKIQNKDTTETQKDHKNFENENPSLPELGVTSEVNNCQSEKSKLKSKEKGTFARILSVIFSWTAIQLFFSHHPFCETFDNHVFKIGKLRFCKGCFLSYPIAYTIPIIYFIWKAARSFLLFTPLWISNLWWFTIYTAIFTFITRYLGRRSMFANDLSKFIRGALAGFLFIIIISEIWYLKIIAAVALFGGMLYLSLKRGKEMQHTCNQCEYGGDFNNCPGWRDISEIFSTEKSESSLKKE